MIDLMKLTTEETAQLVKEAIALLPDEQLFAVLTDSLTTEQKEELGESWFNIDR
jgi:hypothetical protein